jgi:type II secretory pathway pseudopilin PulG
MNRPKKLGKLFSILGSESGATLVEELVSIAIIGIGIVILVAMITTGTLGVSKIDDLVRAQSLARSQLELIKDAPYETDPPSFPYPSVVGIPGYSVVVGIEYWNASTSSFQTDWRDDGMQKLTITVSSGATQLSQVSEFKVDR